MNNEENNFNQPTPFNQQPTVNQTPQIPIPETPAEPEKNQKRIYFKPRKKSEKIISAISIIIILACGVNFLLQQDFVKDRLTAWSFNPSAEISAITEKLNLTDAGKLIFNASTPALESREDFNKHCDSHEEEVSVLGCYTDRKIYLYDIKTDELSGVVESTAAHELLHAVWERLSSSEQDEIKIKLDQVFADHHDLLAEDLESYDESEWTDELYVRIATQIADLPDELEEHYAKYFNDQDAVVAYYDSYITPFRELEEEMRTLEKELGELGAKIDQQTAEYESRANSLSAAVDEFNNCADTINCFSSIQAFTARRNELLAEQAALDALYEELNANIETYNQKVEKYNSSLLRTKELENIINSNVDPDEIIK